MAGVVDYTDKFLIFYVLSLLHVVLCCRGGKEHFRVPWPDIWSTGIWPMDI